MEHRIEMCPFVQILDAPVPQMGDQVLELLQKFVSSLVEPVPRTLGRRSGCNGTQWSSLPTSLPWYRFWM